MESHGQMAGEVLLESVRFCRSSRARERHRLPEACAAVMLAQGERRQRDS